MSTGVPNTMVVEMKLSTSPPALRSLKGIATLSTEIGRRTRRHPIGFQLLIQLEQFGIGRRLALPVQPLQKMRAPFGEVDRARRQPLGVKGKPQDVEGLPEQMRRDAFEQRRHHAVGRHQIPVPVIGQRRIGFMRLQDEIDRLPGGFERGIVERALRKGRANPAATRSTLRSRKGTSNRSASFSTISRDGAARPVSTKLR